MAANFVLFVSFLLCASNVADDSPYVNQQKENLRSPRFVERKKIKALITNSIQIKLSNLPSGDIHPHPGPSSSHRKTTGGKVNRRISFPCTVCNVGVTKASKAIDCDLCKHWTHVRCTPRVSLSRYDECVKTGGEISFTCDICAWATLPFADEAIDVNGVDRAGAGAAPAQSSSTTQVNADIPFDLFPKSLQSKGSNVRSLRLYIHFGCPLEKKSFLADISND